MTAAKPGRRSSAEFPRTNRLTRSVKIRNARACCSPQRNGPYTSRSTMAIIGNRCKTTYPRRLFATSSSTVTTYSRERTAGRSGSSTTSRRYATRGGRARTRRRICTSPAPQSARRRDAYTDTPLPPDEPAGENPPDGAIFDYTIGANVTGPLTLTITDAAGHVVRTYASTDRQVPIEPDIDVPVYWVRPTRIPSATPGHHRFRMGSALPGAASGVARLSDLRDRPRYATRSARRARKSRHVSRHAGRRRRGSDVALVPHRARSAGHDSGPRFYRAIRSRAAYRRRDESRVRGDARREAEEEREVRCSLRHAQRGPSAECSISSRMQTPRRRSPHVRRSIASSGTSRAVIA